MSKRCAAHVAAYHTAEQQILRTLRATIWWPTMFTYPWISVGLDPDAWRILLSAKHLAISHEYAASRLPGYPIPESVFSLVAADPTWVPLVLTFIISCLGFLCFYLLVESLGFPDPGLMTAAFACMPVVLINTMTTMDYMWAMTFILASFLTASRNKFVFSGLLLGIAIGCRITSGIMLLPLMILAIVSTDDELLRRRRMIVMGAGACLVALICYLPALRKYGLGMFSFESTGDGSLSHTIKVVVIDTFGVVGSFALVAASFLSLASNNPYLLPEGKVRIWSILCLIVIVLYATAFVFLPKDPGNLIPLVPFLLLLTPFVMPRPLFRLVAYGCILSPFLFSIESADRPWSIASTPLSADVHVMARKLSVDVLRGPLVTDWMQRQNQLDYGLKILQWAQGRTTNSVIVAGGWTPLLAYAAERPLPVEASDKMKFGRSIVVALLTAEDAAVFRKLGFSFYHIPGQGPNNLGIHGVSLGALESEEVVP